MEHLVANSGVNSDSFVIEKVRNGDTAFFEVLIRRYNLVLYKIARSFGFNHKDAEDLMQEAHVAAYLAINGFEERSSYKTWISKIMIHKCGYKRKYGYFKNEVSSELTQTTNESMESKSNSPEETLLSRELALILERSLEKIPIHYRTIFVLREIEGFSVAETANLLKISPVNVKVRLSRAKALLQKQIEQVYTHKELFTFNLVYCDAVVQGVYAKIKAIENDNRGNQQSSCLI